MSKSPSPGQEVGAYSILAAGYDVVMEHVDYDLWAAYVHGLITDFHPEAETVLELGCGTGSFALSLRQIEQFRYLATDGSPKMVRVAEAKAEMEGAHDIQWVVADFTNFSVDQAVDVVLLLYDGMNYLLEEEELDKLFGCAFRALGSGGLFVFDQSTPANSINNETLFEDSGEAEGFSYVRHSRYDSESRIHTTVFEINALDQQFREEHRQRAYTVDEVRAAADRAGFEVAASFEDFGRDPVTERTERVHWVLRRP
ncbi:MAG: class I SAM-dependent methyltransferase [Rhodothermales bacterium]|nr:class I SAM-dependent methyltransferase [Rhodothermales bacterium]MBO6780782.1 class I SAM-dependent methyltransferase [Rhodothermales bacterium]